MKTKIILIMLFTAFILFSCGKKTEVTTPVIKDVTEMVFASGVLEANNTYNLTAQTEGYLIKINFEEGDIIETGTVLAEVDNQQNNFNNESASALYMIAQNNITNSAPAIEQAKNSMTLTKQKLEVDSVMFVKYKALFEKNTVSKTEYNNYYLQFITSQSNYYSACKNYELVKQQAEQQLISSKTTKNISSILSSNNQIKAVVGGKVYKKLKQPGDYVHSGDIIAIIGDASLIYAKVNIDESNISKIAIGQNAVIQLNTNTEKSYKGLVTEIYPSFDDESQSFLCKIAFTDSLNFKIVGTQLQSNIIIAEKKSALLIPRNFLDFDGTVKMKGNNKKIAVKTEFISNEWVQVSTILDVNSALETENISSNKLNPSEFGSQIK